MSHCLRKDMLLLPDRSIVARSSSLVMSDHALVQSLSRMSFQQSLHEADIIILG